MYVCKCLCTCMCKDLLSDFKFSLPVTPVLLTLQTGFQPCSFHPGTQLLKLVSLSKGDF